ncbi:MAG: 50S ribosomal protein L24e [Candidatus Nanoarchaeia archaeon]|jgi:large subunit ribosomal protein L24e
MNCSYCKGEIEQGRGVFVVKKDGKINRFCSSKCRKNFNLKRNPSKLKWITKEVKKK